MMSDDGATEDENEKKKFKEKLEEFEKLGATGVDVDKKMLDGRKQNRGYTMSVGRSKAEDVDIAALRKGTRAQTLPAMSTRRGDLMLSPESQQELWEEQKTLAARIRRGSVSVPVAAQVSEDDLKKTWEEHATCHVHGIMTEGQAAGDEREREFFGSQALPGSHPPIISCHKGQKGFRDTTPNQDNFSITYFKNGYTLACTFDGHGPYGHIVSTQTVQTVPYYLARSAAFPKDMKAALTEAFESAQKEIVMKAVTEGWDVQASGSTAVAACWKGDTVWTANCGDSRCVISTEKNRTVTFETEDHKPNTPAEKERIEKMGGEVRTQTYSDGWVNHRIFVKGKDFPGLCMARTLGDESVKAHGVIATPEVCESKVNLEERPFFVLASDGIWEFLESAFVAKAVAKKIESDGPEKTVQKLQKEARKRWRQEEGDYCDDITSILVQLR
mmetsp:Transcript_69221/g.165990  ORF Transcript_69221/g.165990 Transcript_69221/m.165990 type:complete len:444 (-) Transcript_69221:194-1525(-)